MVKFFKFGEFDYLDKIHQMDLDNQEYFSRLLNSVNGFSSSQLHSVLENHNWDEGFTIPLAIALSPECDLGTALEMFDLSEAEYVIRDMIDDFNTQLKSEKKPTHTELIEQLIDNQEGTFYKILYKKIKNKEYKNFCIYKWNRFLPIYEKVWFDKDYVKEPDNIKLLKDNYYIKDNQVYFYGTKIPWDASTFKSLWDYYAKDKNNLFYGSNIIEKVDGNTYKKLKYNYAKDLYNVFYDWKVLPWSHAETFEILNNSYARDKYNVYYNWKTIELSDWKTFELLYFWWKDKNNIYVQWKIIKWSHGESLEKLDDAYWKDKNYWYYDSCTWLKKISWSSGSSFSWLGEWYAKDEKYVYYGWEKIKWSKASWFINFKNTCYAKDLLYWYYKWLKIEWSDWESLKVLNYYYAKDKNNAYYQWKIIKWVDISSFVRVKKEYSKDKNNVYCQWIILPKADSKTFVVLDGSYSKDEKNVFYWLERIRWADSKTFITQDYAYAKDKNNTYAHWKIKNPSKWTSLFEKLFY